MGAALNTTLGPKACQTLIGGLRAVAKDTTEGTRLCVAHAMLSGTHARARPRKGEEDDQEGDGPPVRERNKAARVQTGERVEPDQKRHGPKHPTVRSKMDGHD